MTCRVALCDHVLSTIDRMSHGKSDIAVLVERLKVRRVYGREKARRLRIIKKIENGGALMLLGHGEKSDAVHCRARFQFCGVGHR